MLYTKGGKMFSGTITYSIVNEDFSRGMLHGINNYNLRILKRSNTLILIANMEAAVNWCKTDS